MTKVAVLTVLALVVAGGGWWAFGPGGQDHEAALTAPGGAVEVQRKAGAAKRNGDLANRRTVSGI